MEKSRALVKAGKMTAGMKIMVLLFATAYLLGCATSATHKVDKKAADSGQPPIDSAKTNEPSVQPAGDKNKSSVEPIVIQVPANIDVLAVDGKGIGIDYMPMYGHSIIKMTPGKHVILLRYSGLSEGAAFDQKEMLYSPRLELALNAEKSHGYVIGYETPRVDPKVDKQIKSLNVWIKDINTQVIVSKPAVPFGVTGTNVAAVPPKPAAPALLPDKAQPPLVHLKYWWNAANENERGDFLRWAVIQK